MKIGTCSAQKNVEEKKKRKSDLFSSRERKMENKDNIIKVQLRVLKERRKKIEELEKRNKYLQETIDGIAIIEKKKRKELHRKFLGGVT